MPVFTLQGKTPRIAGDAYVAPGATLIGAVTVGSRSSIWPGAVIRADNDAITIGDRSNVQDGAVLHTDTGYVLRIGADVTVGHLAMLHGCIVGDGTLIGIGAVVLNGAVIGAGSLIGAGALVTAGTVVPERSLVLGSPGRIARPVAESESDSLRRASDSYVQRVKLYRDGLVLVEV